MDFIHTNIDVYPLFKYTDFTDPNGEDIKTFLNQFRNDKLEITGNNVTPLQ